jgi:hypothetical protein
MAARPTKSFSERAGLERPPEIQVGQMNDELRNSLWNFLYTLYERPDKRYWDEVVPHIARFVAKIPVDDLPYEDYDKRSWLKKYFMALSWHKVYGLVEFVVTNHREMTAIDQSPYSPLYHPVNNAMVLAAVNSVLEREASGYRFIGGVVTPIATQVEVDEIEGVMRSAAEKGFDGAHKHIKIALELLGKKPEPDYRNSIKESISAVESVAKLITGESGGGLDGALVRLAKEAEIHGALRAGFGSLYGYTSNEDGIRHAILEEPKVGYAEAKYMLVSCSAFVGYLITKADEAGLLKRE